MRFAKIIRANIIALIIVSITSHAEGLKEGKSGVFIGLQLGNSTAQLKHKYYYTNQGNVPPVEQEKEDTHISYGLLSGYQHWFNNNFGMRGYAIFSMYNFEVMQFGIGADIIYNFVNVACGNLGVFSGFQVGGMYSYDSWYWVREFKHPNPFALDTALNIGVRYSGNKHAFELVVKIPFMGIHSGLHKPQYGQHTIDQEEYYWQEIYSVVWRYTYSF